MKTWFFQKEVLNLLESTKKKFLLKWRLFRENFKILQQNVLFIVRNVIEYKGGRFVKEDHVRETEFLTE